MRRSSTIAAYFPLFSFSIASAPSLATSVTKSRCRTAVTSVHVASLSSTRRTLGFSIFDFGPRYSTRQMGKARKEAGKLRRGFNKEKGRERAGPVNEEHWEELLDQDGRTRKRSKLPQIIAQLEPSPDATSATEIDPKSAAIVMSVTGANCRVFRDGEEIDCNVPPHIAMLRGSALAAGDRVVLSGDTVETVLPRQSVLARPDPINKHLQRMIAANVDVVVHVVSVKSPPLRPRLRDRYLLAIQRGGAQPVLCVNKIDLLSDQEREGELAKLAPYRELEVPVIAVSTKSGEGLDALRREVEGKLAALVGHSGVGKSSILNAIDERLQLATGGLHRRGTGRHTTTRATLYHLDPKSFAWANRA